MNILHSYYFFQSDENVDDSSKMSPQSIIPLFSRYRFRYMRSPTIQLKLNKSPAIFITRNIGPSVRYAAEQITDKRNSTSRRSPASLRAIGKIAPAKSRRIQMGSRLPCTRTSVVKGATQNSGSRAERFSIRSDRCGITRGSNGTGVAASRD